MPYIFRLRILILHIAMNLFKFFILIALALPAIALPVQDGVCQAARNASVVPAPEARQSPMALAATRIDGGNTYVKVVYGSPRARGREIFGGLVPYDRVWRTGANEATELTLTGPVTFAGEPLKAGTYAIFSIPNEDSWTIILNNGLGQWGAYEYDDELDLLRVEVPVEEAGAIHDAFTIRFDEAAGGTDMVILWDQTLVRVPIRSR